MIAQLKDIRKQYGQKDKPVLDGISLQIGKNEAIAITGPSGSGKTTLLNILGTLDCEYEGSAEIGGKDPKSMNEPGLAGLRNGFIGFVFQLHYLLPQLTLLENILLPTLPMKDRTLRKTRLERADFLVRRMGLQGLENRLPSALSVGECQRAAFARALINKPSLLLADEPTGSLDAGNAAMMGELMMQLRREEELALLVVTHSPTIASLMDKEYRLVSGRLIPAEKR
jgi:ABC-type lipoprotein export system ATPase subunit